MDMNGTLQDDRATVMLNAGCIEDPTTFISVLSYGSCPDDATFQERQTISSSSKAVFVLNLNCVTVL